MNRLLGLVLLAIGIVHALVGLMGVVVVASALRGGVGLLAFFLFIGLLGTGLVYGGYRVMRSAKPIGAQPGPGQFGEYLPDVSQSRQHQGRAYEVFFQKPTTGKNRRPSCLIVRVPAATPTTLQFNEENWFDRFCKGVGIAREHQTGDRDFDEAVYVRGPCDGYAEQYLQDDHKRSAIRAIKNEGFRAVRLTGSNVEAVWIGFNPSSDDRPGLTESAAQQLFALADRLPQEDASRPFARRDPHTTRHACLWIFLLALAAMLGFAFYYPPIRTGDLALAGLAIMLFVYPLFGWVAAFLLRGTSIAHDRWVLLMALGLFLIGLGCIGSVAAANALLDPGPLEERIVTISDKRVHQGRRNARSYYVAVPAWDRPGDTIEFQVSATQYSTITPGQSRLDLTTSPGALGIEWLHTKRIR